MTQFPAPGTTMYVAEARKQGFWIPEETVLRDIIKTGQLVPNGPFMVIEDLYKLPCVSLGNGEAMLLQPTDQVVFDKPISASDS